jgi:cyclic pyranopterin phosphate synthase
MAKDGAGEDATPAARGRQDGLTHLDEAGRARMVDVSGKPVTARRAVATGAVAFSERAFTLLRDQRLEKGDALAVARLAGIAAGKRTADWIPLCHTVPLDRLDVEVELLEPSREARVTATAAATWTTGVEMEALVAVAAACLALYDMAKAVDRGIEIRGIRLLEKEGGRLGSWVRS